MKGYHEVAIAISFWDNLSFFEIFYFKVLLFLYLCFLIHYLFRQDNERDRKEGKNLDPDDFSSSGFKRKYINTLFYSLSLRILQFKWFASFYLLLHSLA